MAFCCELCRTSRKKASVPSTGAGVCVDPFVAVLLVAGAVHRVRAALPTGVRAAAVRALRAVALHMVRRVSLGCDDSKNCDSMILCFEERGGNTAATTLLGPSTGG